MIQCKCGGEFIGNTRTEYEYAQRCGYVPIGDRVFFSCRKCGRKYGGFLRDEAALKKELKAMMESEAMQ